MAGFPAREEVRRWRADFVWDERGFEMRLEGIWEMGRVGVGRFEEE